MNFRCEVLPDPDEAPCESRVLFIDAPSAEVACVLAMALDGGFGIADYQDRLTTHMWSEMLALAQSYVKVQSFAEAFSLESH